MDITDALMTAAHFHDMEKPQRNSDGETMREAATEIHRLRAERDSLRALSAPGVTQDGYRVSIDEKLGVVFFTFDDRSFATGPRCAFEIMQRAVDDDASRQPAVDWVPWKPGDALAFGWYWVSKRRPNSNEASAGAGDLRQLFRIDERNKFQYAPEEPFYLCSEADALISSLRKQLEASERDAGRYRWLESRISRTGLETHKSGGLSWQEQRWYHVDFRNPVPDSESLSEYIDAAMQPKGEL